LDAPYVIELLERRHVRAAFSCGNAALDSYLKQRASQDARRRLAAVYVACATGSPQVLGFVTLSMSGVELTGLPADVAARLPNYPVLPVALLGRMAVDQTMQGRGLGGHLLIHALRTAAQASTSVAALGVVVDAKNDRARAFYAQFGFVRISDEAFRLFLPMATIAQLFP
jgi:GNAT superfamily N-acetyltransferase